MLSVIDVPQAEKHPGSASVTKTIPAGCKTNRLEFSPDGQYLWVTAVGSNALLGFSAAKLLSDPGHALIARVAVGQSPLGLAVISKGSRIVVADSNRDEGQGAVANLAVVDTARALAGRPRCSATSGRACSPGSLPSPPTAPRCWSPTPSQPRCRRWTSRTCPEPPAVPD